jgi:anti-sigma factor RsiW
VTDHLDDSQISRYIERRGDADEILNVAQHLDHCWECRDRTAAMVDDGASDRPHEHGAHDRSRLSAPIHDGGFRSLPWVILIGIAIVAIAIALLAQK